MPKLKADDVEMKLVQRMPCVAGNIEPVLFASALIGLSSGLAAQGPGHFSPRPEPVVTQASLSAAMGRCLVDRNRAAAVALVKANGEAEERSALGRIRADMIACLRGRPSATLDRLHLTGAIAERLLDDDGKRLLDHATTLPAASPQRVAAGENAGVAALACAVRADPADAAAMLRAPAESAAEATAFGQLAPSLQACVPAEGAVTIKPYVVRATVAVATYRAVSQVN